MQQNSDYKLSIDWLNITMSPRNKYKLGADGEPILSRKGKKKCLQMSFMILTGLIRLTVL